MKRIHEIVDEIRSTYPDDDFFTEFESSCQIFPLKKKYYQTYNNALVILDDASWEILRNKAIKHYFDHRKGQKKQGFFNQLNEAIAYRYLVRKGFNNVKFLKEGNSKRSNPKQPDISFNDKKTQRYCEVKTLCISKDEISKREAQTVYNGSIYLCLSDGFLIQLKSAIARAWEQINSVGQDGLVFIIINFDDIALYHYQTYRRQIVQFCYDQGFDNLFIKIGLLGNRRICISQRGVEPR